MAQRHSIEASLRTIIGKETKKLRRDGQLPGVIYGPLVGTPISVTVDTKELSRMYQAFGSNYLIDITVNGSSHTVYMRTVTIDRLHRVPLHAEFFAPNMRQEITTHVPVMVIGEPKAKEGVLTYTLESIEVRGLPDNLPAMIEVDASVLEDYDQSILVGDIRVPGDVTVITDPETMVLRVSAPRSMVAAADEEEAVEAGEEAAEDSGQADASGATETDEGS